MCDPFSGHKLPTTLQWCGTRAPESEIMSNSTLVQLQLLSIFLMIKLCITSYCIGKIEHLYLLKRPCWTYFLTFLPHSLRLKGVVMSSALCFWVQASICLYIYKCMDQSRYGPSQWETSLHCNDVSHWLDAYLDWSLQLCMCASSWLATIFHMFASYLVHSLALLWTWIILIMARIR